MARRLTVWNPWALMPEDNFDFEPFGFNEADPISMDLYEEGDDVVLELKAPGFGKDDIKIQVENNVITVNGKIKEEKEEKRKDRKYYRREIRNMSFSRSAELPAMVKADAAKAQFENGMLKVTLPKREEAKPKSISIDVK